MEHGHRALLLALPAAVIEGRGLGIGVPGELLDCDDVGPGVEQVPDVAAAPSRRARDASSPATTRS